MCFCIVIVMGVCVIGDLFKIASFSSDDDSLESHFESTVFRPYCLAQLVRDTAVQNTAS